MHKTATLGKNIMSMYTPFKKANVDYSCNPYRKTLAVPLMTAPFQFGTGMKDPVWKQAVSAKDFVPFRRAALEKGSEFSVFRTETELVIGLFFLENPADLVRQKDPRSSVWSGDMAELHFGGMEPDPWLYQTCIGIRGNRFDSMGTYDRWQARTFENENGWGAELRFDLSLFRITEGGFRFNVCRQALGRNEFSCWSPLRLRFHEVENFGELLLTDYKTALQLKTGRTLGAAAISREEYQQAMAKEMIPAQKIVHGPYLSCPEKESICISWETAGLVPSFLEYREKGSGEVKTAYSGREHGILRHDTTHFVRLTGLIPGREYEYEIMTLRPVTLEADHSGIRRTFKMPEADGCSVSFRCIADIHSDVRYLRNSLAAPGGGKSLFYALLGDNLSHAAGREALYTGIIDPIIAANDRSGGPDKPLVFVRGNHEQRGVYASEYFRVMRHHSGRSYYSFTLGSVHFTVLDSGDDAPDETVRHYCSNAEEKTAQKAFLLELTDSPEYKYAAFRAVMIHIPPVEKKAGSISEEMYGMLEPLRNAKVPPDVMLCGHTHQYERTLANEGGYAYSTNRKHTPGTETLILPWPVVICSCNTILDCTVTGRTMTIEVYDVLSKAEPLLLETVNIGGNSEN